VQPGSIEKLFARDATACRRAWRFAQTRISENLVRFRCLPPRPIGSDTKVRGVEAPGYLLLAAKQRADLFGYPAHVKIGAFLSYKTSDFCHANHQNVGADVGTIQGGKRFGNSSL